LIDQKFISYKLFMHNLKQFENILYIIENRQNCCVR
jgi:hypothetical protein